MFTRAFWELGCFLGRSDIDLHERADGGQARTEAHTLATAHSTSGFVGVETKRATDASKQQLAGPDGGPGRDDRDDGHQASRIVGMPAAWQPSQRGN